MMNTQSFIETSLSVLVELLHIGYFRQDKPKYIKKLNLVCNRLLIRCNTDVNEMLENMH